MNAHQEIARETIFEVITALSNRYQPYEGGGTLRTPWYLPDNRYLGDNDILYSQEFEGLSTLRYHIRKFSDAVERDDTQALLSIVEDLFETAIEFNLDLRLDQESIENAANILLCNEGAVLYQPPRVELIELPKIITAFSDELISLLARKPSYLHALSPRDFEELIAEIFARQGFEVHLTKQTRDGGKDIIALYKKLGIQTKYIIECKRYTNKVVGIELVQRLAGVRHALSANKAILATTSRFSRPAIEWAKQEVNLWSLDLKDYDDIVDWLQPLALTNPSTRTR